MTSVQCFNCKEMGHYSSSCPHPKLEVSATGCRYCKAEGHTMDNCPKRAVGVKSFTPASAIQSGQPLSSQYNADVGKAMRIMTAPWGTMHITPDGRQYAAPINFEAMKEEFVTLAMAGTGMKFNPAQVLEIVKSLRQNMAQERETTTATLA
jgi:hypothetical protein